ncbi:MAG: nuclear transport factor 2 family protein [bacterium]
MTTRETLQGYFTSLIEKKEWQSYFADDVAFTSHTSPVKQLTGKNVFLQATQRFYSSIAVVEVRELLIDGERACAQTRYEIQPPNGGASFQSDVAELFSVRNGKITSFAIYFDSAPYPK